MPKRRKPEEQRHCELPGCDRMIYYGRGLCSMHWQRARGRGLRPEEALALWGEDTSEHGRLRPKEFA